MDSDQTEYWPQLLVSVPTFEALSLGSKQMWTEILLLLQSGALWPGPVVLCGFSLSICEMGMIILPRTAVKTSSRTDLNVKSTSSLHTCHGEILGKSPNLTRPQFSRLRKERYLRKERCLTCKVVLKITWNNAVSLTWAPFLGFTFVF